MIGGHLVLVETAGNQRYIFASNVLREAFGASRLVERAGREWFKAAVAGGKILLCASGKGIALVSDRAASECVVRTVSEAALRKAPGLRVYGAVVEIAGSDAGSLDQAIHAAHERLGDLRRRLGEAETGLMLPVAAPCRSTGAAAQGFDKSEPDGAVPFSAAVLAKRRARDAATGARDDLLARLTTVDGTANAFRLKGDEEDADWVAVIHADGNGLGQTFRDILKLSGIGDSAPADRYATVYRDFSAALDECCKAAAAAALHAVWEAEDRPREVYFRPLIIAGDDLTVVCEGRHALRFARSFLDEFSRLTAANQAITAICRHGLSAGAGIAVVKPHFPFHRAYELAGVLAKKAKDTAKKAVNDQPEGTPPPASLDFRVVIDGALTAEGKGPRGGPYASGEPGTASLAPLASLDRAVAALHSGVLPRGQQHALREAAVQGEGAAKAAVTLIRHRYEGFDWGAIADDDNALSDSGGLLMDALSLIALDRAGGGGSE